VGRKWGALVFLLDLLKGLVPTFLAGRFLATAGADTAPVAVIALCWLLAGFCAVLGHNYSPFLSFSGGKGVSTSLGVAFGVHPHLTIPALAAFGAWALAIRLTGMSSLGSISGALLFPVVYLISVWAKGETLADTWPFLGFSLVVSAVVLLRHKQNIVRILNGTEARFSRSAPTDADGPGGSR
jgi:glycerol-3-phosphate acyltransferase PlsY